MKKRNENEKVCRNCEKLKFYDISRKIYSCEYEFSETFLSENFVKNFGCEKFEMVENITDMIKN